MPTHNIRKLTPRDVDEAAGVLARAFFDYPMWTWIIPDDAHRRAALPPIMRVSMRWGLLTDEVYGAGDPLRAVAIWSPPGMADADLDPDGTRTHFQEAVDAIGADGAARMDLLVAEQRSLRDRDLTPNTWYLPWLGVDPVSQRTGAGTALLNSMFARLDATKSDIYLETEKAANVPYYHQHGFTTITKGTITNGGPNYWTLRRTPPPPP